MTSYVSNLLADAQAGKVVPFAQRRLSDLRVVGCTQVDLEIPLLDGARSARRSGGRRHLARSIRAGAHRSTPNSQAVAAHERVRGLGGPTFWRSATTPATRRAAPRSSGSAATFEGVLRSHRASDVAGEAGKPRTRQAHSILDSEWHAVKANLIARLAAAD